MGKNSSTKWTLRKLVDLIMSRYLHFGLEGEKKKTVHYSKVSLRISSYTMYQFLWNLRVFLLVKVAFYLERKERRKIEIRSSFKASYQIFFFIV